MIIEKVKCEDCDNIRDKRKDSKPDEWIRIDKIWFFIDDSNAFQAERLDFCSLTCLTDYIRKAKGKGK